MTVSTRKVTERLVRDFVGTLGHVPRVIVGGNAGVPRRLLALVDGVVAEHRLFMINAPRGIPVREGVALETPFVGPGMRGQTALAYVPARLKRSVAAHIIGSTSFFITIVNSLVAGTLGALVAGTAQSATSITALAGVLAGLAYLLVQIEIGRRSFGGPFVDTRFPTPTD